MKDFFVYILTNTYNTTFYIGVTNNLERRISEYRQGFVDGFTKKYRLTKLVYYEQCSVIEDALRREKQLKNWRRAWKINLIKATNPIMKDLGDAEINSA